ncbi:rhomboid family intramembrane serine protease [bacterium]|nr:rhomboid family intramembrane serine protease [bacterium]
MLIIPLTGNIRKHKLSIITILIILINIFCFFVFQAHDNERYLEAYQFYSDSGLEKIELSAYSVYLEKKSGAEKSLKTDDVKELKQEEIDRLLKRMQGDDIFLRRLSNDEIITPGQETYNEWRSLRTEFEKLLENVISYRYGYKPSRMDPLTVLTHMFLHGDIMHILGNMIFLWLVGCMLELGCSRLFYVVLYLAGGICAVALFTVFNMNSNVPLIGASGAIAALMGAFTVMYGKTKIKVFYSLGFYFNYAKISAILLFPIWIANEVFQMIFGGESRIAYVAHLGGLLGGGAIGYGYRRFFKMADEKVFEEDPKEKIPVLLEKALEKISKLDMNKARPILMEILGIDPHNDIALMHLFNVDKLNPGSNEFHETALTLIQHLSQDSKRHDELYKVYQEFSRLSKPLEIDRDILFRVASVFNASGRLREAEHILASFMKKHPNFPKLPTGILNLGRAYLKKGENERGEKCLKIICQRYPGSDESRIALELLKGSRRTVA